jgi:hypothetical protein
MVITKRHIELFAPVAAGIVASDARAIERVEERKGLYAGLDPQPAAVARASERRALVATDMRRDIAPEASWTLVEDHLRNGAYEWHGPRGELIRLAKTTPESRKLEAAKSFQGIQEELVVPQPPPTGPREEILIRLMGDPLGDPSVDIVCVGRKGVRSSAVSLAAMAKAQTDQFPAKTPEKASVTLPGTRRDAETG